MTMTMTRDELAKRATTRGYTLHESVTDARLARVHPKMLNGRPDRLTQKLASNLDADESSIAAWIDAGCYVSSYSLGQPGDEVIGPPTADEALMLVTLRSWRVVAVVTGQGQRTDGDDVSMGGMSYSILRE